MTNQAAYYEGNKTFRIAEATIVPPGPGEVRIAVKYCGICGTDIHIYHGKMDQRVKMPQVIGHEASGVVAEVGPEVTNVKPGDRVAVRPLRPGEPAPVDNGYTHIGQNLKFIGIDTPGALQASWTVPAHSLHLLPSTVSDEHGALIEPLAVACHDVRLSRLKPGENVVIIGGGPIGLLIGLVAQRKGARVLISEVNARRRDLAQQLGLATVHPLEENLVEAVGRFTEQAFADLVFEVSGTQAGVEVMTKLPRVRGRIVMVAIHAQPPPVELFRFFWRELEMIGVRVYEPQDFEAAIALAAEKKLPLDRLVTEVAPLADLQQVFERIDRNPDGMKYLLKCS